MEYCTKLELTTSEFRKLENSMLWVFFFYLFGSTTKHNIESTCLVLLSCFKLFQRKTINFIMEKTAKETLMVRIPLNNVRLSKGIYFFNYIMQIFIKSKNYCYI